MFDYPHFFESRGSRTIVVLPFPLDEAISAWVGLCSAMRRSVPPEFSRDEWAYLMTFLAGENLRRPFLDSFGSPGTACEHPDFYQRPCGTVAVWLPNNVSLLGPLTLVLLSLTGNRLLLKSGSHAEDLTLAFLRYSAEHLPDGPLRKHLRDHIELDVFDRADPRNSEFASRADIRIVFGSGQAASAIQALSSDPNALQFSFSDRQSRAWIDVDSATDDVLATLIRVFAVYGQAGCTSPRRCCVVGGTHEDALRIRDRLRGLWSRTVKRPPVHLASSNFMAAQLAAALGWDAEVAGENHAAIGVAAADVPVVDAPGFLAVSPATLAGALAELPGNIQTLGHALAPAHQAVLQCAARAKKVKRVVPLAGMHHFGHVWDGYDFWRSCFERVEYAL